MGDVSTPHATPVGLDPLITPVSQTPTVDGVSGGNAEQAVTRSQKRKRDEKEALKVSPHARISRVTIVVSSVYPSVPRSRCA